MFFKAHIRWIEVLSNSDFLVNYVENVIYPVNLEGKSLLSTKYGSKLYVFDDKCPHQGMSLKYGACLNGKVICQWHKYAYCLESGKDLSTSGSTLKVYQVKLENDFWYVAWEERLPFWMDSV